MAGKFNITIKTKKEQLRRLFFCAFPFSLSSFELEAFNKTQKAPSLAECLLFRR
jgi:hypothetical protein